MELGQNLSYKTVTRMKYLHIIILVFGLLLSCNSKEKKKTSYLSSQDIVMAAPILEYDNLFFTDSVEVTMKFSLPNSSIKYTLDGSDVTSDSKTYEKPIFLNKTTQIEAQNFHQEFQWSTSAILKVVKTNTKLMGSKIEISPSPNERYQGNGVISLSDHIKGTTAFANGNAWLGFQADSVLMKVNFPEVKSLSKVMVSTIANHGAWIFLPKIITVFSGNSKVGSTEVLYPSEQDKTRLEFIEIPIEAKEYENLKIMVTSLNEIPEWHQGKGTLPWLFIDEILIE